MHDVLHKPRHLFRSFLVGSIALTLSACSTTGVPAEAQPSSSFSRITSLDVAPGTTKAELEALYGGEVILMDAEEGFAVLGFTEKEGVVTTLATEQNQDTFSSPELGAQGATAWAGGATAWAGGATAWAGGATAWAGGATAWAGGVQTHTPLDNYSVWEQIGLYKAHTELAPHLGEGVTVAVIDTGVDLKHPVFTDRLVDGWDFIDNDALPQEEGVGMSYGHGTAVAGVVLQVAPLAKIMPLRILNSDGSGDTDDLLLAIDWAIEHGANIINVSLGSSEDSQPVERVLNKAKAKKVVVVTSAGNSGDKNVTFPANSAVKGGKFSGILISVGSVNAKDEKSSFSAYRKDQVEMAAPGEAIFTAYPDGRVTTSSGTSFAAPMVSGALALALGEPAMSKKGEELPKLVTEKVMDKLYKIEANRDYKGGLGKGRLDLEKFLGEALN